MTIIFTDGSSRGNPGSGGWGSVIVLDSGRVIELGGREEKTTNNRMELTAAIEGMKQVADNETAKVYTDSSYVIKGITQWIEGWKRNNWKTKTKADVLNKDLWIKLDETIWGKKIKWEYVGGHIGIKGNERCDEIATTFADNKKPDLYSGLVETYEIKDILNISHDSGKLATKKSGSSRSSAKAYSYVSSVNGKIEVHKTWAECEKRVKGVKARFKKALNEVEEGEIIREFKKV